MAAVKKTKNKRKTAAKAPPVRRRTRPRWVKLAQPFAVPAFVVLVAVGGLGWLVSSGTAGRAAEWTGRQAIAISGDLGLTVKHVLVTGRQRQPRDAVTEALGAHRGMPILAFDPYQAKARLEALPWVRTATVERRLPDTIYVRLVERQPVALWQMDHQLALIDRDGVVIARDNLGPYRNLPMVVGDGAAERAEAILEVLRTRPEVATRVSAIIRVGNRRWDLQFRDGVTARLPAGGAARAVATLAELIARDGILKRDVATIDLRLPGRLVVQMTPEGLQHLHDLQRDRDSHANRRASRHSKDT